MSYRFSIITCTKNSVKYLKDNIDSVRSQTFSDYEHIFIDGFSNDGTKELILEYQKKYPDKVKLFQSEPKGIANAMNEGIDVARGKYLIHLHSDDYFYDSAVLNDVTKFLDEKKPDWIYSKELRVASSKQRIGLFVDKTIFKFGSKYLLSKYLLKYFDFIRHQSVFIKKDVFKKFGYFDSRFDIAMDYEYWLRIKDKTYWIFFDRVVDCFRIHDDGASSSPHAKTKMCIDEMLASRSYMNPIEFYILRPLFKILIKTLAETERQIDLYKLLPKNK